MNSSFFVHAILVYTSYFCLLKIDNATEKTAIIGNTIYTACKLCLIKPTTPTVNPDQSEPMQNTNQLENQKNDGKRTLSVRNGIGLALIFISLGCLYPGITEPLLQIQVLAQLPIIGQLELYNETQSIIESIRALWQSDNLLVAFLVALFSIAVPLIKALLLTLALVLKSGALKAKLIKFVQLIGKWSMADVFVVSVFMSFLATQSNDFLEAYLHPGFYYFLAYCLISITASLCISVNENQRQTT